MMVRINGEYRPADYCGNVADPLMAALPEMITAEMTEGLECLPVIDEEECNERAEKRIQYLQRLRSFFVNRPEYGEITFKLDTLVRQAYRMRNKNEGSALGYMISGVYGCGKRETVRRLLSLYPEVVYHNEFHGKFFHEIQVPFLQADLTSDGTVLSLCRKVMEKIVLLAGDTDSIPEITVKQEAMVAMMIRKLKKYHVGCIVVEYAETLDAAGKEMYRIFRMLQQLIEYEKISVVLLCGEDIADAVREKPELAITLTSAGETTIVPYEKDEHWDAMIRKLWTCQWLREPPAMTAELMERIYHWCRGVTEIAVRIFMEVQQYALISGKESWDAEDLDRAGRNVVRSIEGYLNAVSRIHPQDVETVLDNI